MSAATRTRLLLALASLVALASGASCGSDDDRCSKLGCYDQFAIEFVQDTWAEGSYDVALDIDGEVIECSFEVPVPESGFIFCQESQSAEFWAYREDSSSPYLPRGVVVIGTPEEVTITVSLDDQELARDSYEVGDERTYPNGEACDDGCLSEQDELRFGASAGGAGGAGGAN